MDICDVKAIHEDVVSRVKLILPHRQRIESSATLFKMFGDDTRLSILLALSENEMCVCDLCALLNLKQSAVSQQLNKLRMSQIINKRREGKMVFYDLADDHIRKILKTGLEHVSE